jgi:hypothetical protein
MSASDWLRQESCCVALYFPASWLCDLPWLLNQLHDCYSHHAALQLMLHHTQHLIIMSAVKQAVKGFLASLILAYMRFMRGLR